MKQLRAHAIAELCQRVEERVCYFIDCQHLGSSCQGTGCDNQICRMDETYCTGCDLRYCQDCFEGHLDGCRGPLTDEHDQRVEQSLTEAAMRVAGARGNPVRSHELHLRSDRPQWRMPSRLQDPGEGAERRVASTLQLESDCRNANREKGTDLAPWSGLGVEGEGDKTGGSQ